MILEVWSVFSARKNVFRKHLQDSRAQRFRNSNTSAGDPPRIGTLLMEEIKGLAMPARAALDAHTC